MMTSQILNFVDFTKIQKFRYLEKETLFFLQVKRIINYPSRATLWHKSSVIKQKGEFQNWCFKKAKHAKISEKQTFLTP